MVQSPAYQRDARILVVSMEKAYSMVKAGPRPTGCVLLLWLVVVVVVVVVIIVVVVVASAYVGICLVFCYVFFVAPLSYIIFLSDHNTFWDVSAKLCQRFLLFTLAAVPLP